MAEATLPLQLPVVAGGTGRQVRDRRLRLGMSVRQLAEEAGVDRGRLAVLESGEPVRETTLAKVVQTLNRLEQEMGMDEPSTPPIRQATYTFEGEQVTFTYTGDPLTPDELEEYARRFMRAIRPQ